MPPGLCEAAQPKREAWFAVSCDTGYVPLCTCFTETLCLVASESASSHYVHTEYIWLIFFSSSSSFFFFFFTSQEFFNFMKVQVIFEVNIKAELLKKKKKKG